MLWASSQSMTISFRLRTAIFCHVAFERRSPLFGIRAGLDLETPSPPLLLAQLKCDLRDAIGIDKRVVRLVRH
jgi:hypothetical protein